MDGNLTDATLRLLEEVKKAQQSPLQKADTGWTVPTSATSGLQFYSLEGPAKLLYPVLTPLRNRTPRVGGMGGAQANWRAITAIDGGVTRVGVAEGKRGAIFQHTTTDYIAKFVTIGGEDKVTMEADLAASGFDDVRARAVQATLQNVMIGEEKLILAGNGSSGIALGVPATPALTVATTGGSLGAITMLVQVVALTLDGFLNASVAGGVPTTIARARAGIAGGTDTIKGGSSNASASASTGVMAGATNKVTATTAAVRGAVAYAWFWGVAGSVLLGAITTVNKVTITDTATGTQNITAITADNSQDSLVFDGFITQAVKSGSGGYFVSSDGATLTADGAGGVTEIDTDLDSFWTNYRLSPNLMLVSSQQGIDITRKVLSGGTAPVHRISIPETAPTLGNVLAGAIVTQYLNKSTHTIVDIMVHPNIPAGMIYYHSDTLPYPLSGTPNVAQILTRLEYYQEEWPRLQREYEYGVYALEVLQHFAPFSCGARVNIAKG